MANVKIKKILKPFTYKGEEYQPGDENVSVSAKYAAQLEKLDYITLDKETSEKVEKATGKAEKNANAGPGK